MACLCQFLYKGSMHCCVFLQNKADRIRKHNLYDCVRACVHACVCACVRVCVNGNKPYYARKYTCEGVKEKILYAPRHQRFLGHSPRLLRRLCATGVLINFAQFTKNNEQVSTISKTFYTAEILYPLRCIWLQIWGWRKTACISAILCECCVPYHVSETASRPGICRRFVLFFPYHLRLRV